MWGLMRTPRSVTSTSPAKFYWGIDESVTYGTSTTILSSTAGIVDTGTSTDRKNASCSADSTYIGTTLVLLATDAYNRYLSATGATLDSTTGLLRITTAQFSNLKSLFFNIGGVRPLHLQPELDISLIHESLEIIRVDSQRANLASLVEQCYWWLCQQHIPDRRGPWQQLRRRS